MGYGGAIAGGAHGRAHHLVMAKDGHRPLFPLRDDEAPVPAGLPLEGIARDPMDGVARG